jgi:glycosyltransferase involved in cell wall biosynthesis
MRRYERDKYKKLDICVSVSEKEKEMTRGVAPEGLPILVAPNGVDTDYFAPIKKDEEEGALVSVGSMDQERNIDASEYFVKDILPLLLERGYDVTYYIVGQNPTDRVLALADHPAVTVTGTVEDVRPIIARASIVVAPYRIGGGVKHKIPIAFSMKKPVVSTSNACQGIDVTHEENVLIGDSASQFASLIVQLLSSQEMRQQMGEKARTFIQERYSWNAIAHNLINDVEDIINSARLTQ